MNQRRRSLPGWHPLCLEATRARVGWHQALQRGIVFLATMLISAALPREIVAQEPSPSTLAPSDCIPVTIGSRAGAKLCTRHGDGELSVALMWRGTLGPWTNLGPAPDPDVRLVRVSATQSVLLTPVPGPFAVLEFTASREPSVLWSGQSSYHGDPGERTRETLGGYAGGPELSSALGPTSGEQTAALRGLWVVVEHESLERCIGASAPRQILTWKDNNFVPTTSRRTGAAEAPPINGAATPPPAHSIAFNAVNAGRLVDLGYGRYAQTIRARLPSYGLTRLSVALPSDAPATASVVITDATGNRTPMTTVPPLMTYSFEPMLTTACVVATGPLATAHGLQGHSSLDDRTADLLWPSLVSDFLGTDAARAADAEQVLRARRQSALASILSAWPTLPVAKQTKILRMLLSAPGARLSDEALARVLTFVPPYLRASTPEQQTQTTELLFAYFPATSQVLQDYARTCDESMRARLLPRLVTVLDHNSSLTLLQSLPTTPALRQALRTLYSVATEAERLAWLAQSTSEWRALALSEWTTREASNELLTVLRNALQNQDPEQSFETRWNLVQAAAQARSDEEIDQRLADLARSDAPWMLRAKAGRVLWERGRGGSAFGNANTAAENTPLLNLLLAQAEDASPRLRQQAMELLGELPVGPSVRTLTDHARTDGWPRVRAEAFVSLLAVHLEKIEITRLAMRDPSGLVRDEALRALLVQHQLVDHAEASLLMREVLADEREVPSVLARAIEYVEASCDASAIPALHALIARVSGFGQDHSVAELGPRATTALTNIAQCSAPSGATPAPTPVRTEGITP